MLSTRFRSGPVSSPQLRLTPNGRAEAIGLGLISDAFSAAHEQDGGNLPPRSCAATAEFADTP